MKPVFATQVTLNWLQYVNGWVLSTQLFCPHQHVTHKLDLDQMSERSISTLKDTYMIKLTFCCKCWVYLLSMTLFEWFWWYMWPKMAFKMFQEFPTISLNISLTEPVPALLRPETFLFSYPPTPQTWIWHSLPSSVSFYVHGDHKDD